MHPKYFRFLDSGWRNDEEIASEALQIYSENVSYTDYGCYKLKYNGVRKNYVFQKTHFTNQHHFYFDKNVHQHTDCHTDKTLNC